MTTPERPTMLVLTAAAGLVHLGQVVPHLRGTWLAGAAFLLLGLAQLAAVAVAWHAPRRGGMALIAVDAAAVAAWAASRTVGLPLGLGHDTTEVLAVLTVGVEVVAIGAALVPARAAWRRPVLAASIALLLPLPVVAAGSGGSGHVADPGRHDLHPSTRAHDHAPGHDHAAGARATGREATQTPSW